MTSSWLRYHDDVMILIHLQGSIPNLGDKVSYEAQRTTAASCWNATKVRVVQFSQSINKTEPGNVSLLKH